MKHDAVRLALTLMAALVLAGLAGSAPRTALAGYGTTSDPALSPAPQTQWLACSSTCVDPDGG